MNDLFLMKFIVASELIWKDSRFFQKTDAMEFRFSAYICRYFLDISSLFLNLCSY